MRIRKPFAAAFVGLVIITAVAGFSPPDYSIPTYKQSDKVLHFISFFLLTLTFYWILETSRRKVLQLTFTVCTIGLGLASEIVQGLLPVRTGRRNQMSQMETGIEDISFRTKIKDMLTSTQIHREFDYYDVLSNVLGSVAAVAVCNWYHKRMLERKRAARGYVAVAEDDDVELGEGMGGQENGIVRPTVEEELEQWDENAEDWDTTEPAETSNGQAHDVSGDLGEGKKRND